VGVRVMPNGSAATDAAAALVHLLVTNSASADEPVCVDARPARVLVNSNDLSS